jgi:hypothetical protein
VSRKAHPTEEGEEAIYYPKARIYYWNKDGYL